MWCVYTMTWYEMMCQRWYIKIQQWISAWCHGMLEWLMVCVIPSLKWNLQFWENYYDLKKKFRELHCIPQPL